MCEFAEKHRNKIDESAEKRQNKIDEFAVISYNKINEFAERRESTVFKRKIYDKLLYWKNTSNGKTALLIEGPRRVGKSTVVEEFAKNEYESYILVDFFTASPETKALFDDLSDLNYLFLQLQLTYQTSLKERKSR